MNFNKTILLDGTPEEQKEHTEWFFSLLTEEQIKESMSDKYAYLDEDLPGDEE